MAMFSAREAITEMLPAVRRSHSQHNEQYTFMRSALASTSTRGDVPESQKDDDVPPAVVRLQTSLRHHARWEIISNQNLAAMVLTRIREDQGSNPGPAVLINVFRGFPKSLQANAAMGHGGRAVSLLTSHQGDPGSIPGRVTPDFHMWGSCRTMTLIGGFSRSSAISPSPSFRRYSTLTSITLIGSQELDVKSPPNIFTNLYKTVFFKLFTGSTPASKLRRRTAHAPHTANSPSRSADFVDSPLASPTTSQARSRSQTHLKSRNVSKQLSTAPLLVTPCIRHKKPSYTSRQHFRRSSPKLQPSVVVAHISLLTRPSAPPLLRHQRSRTAAPTNTGFGTVFTTACTTRYRLGAARVGNSRSFGRLPSKARSRAGTASRLSVVSPAVTLLLTCTTHNQMGNRRRFGGASFDIPKHQLLPCHQAVGKRVLLRYWIYKGCSRTYPFTDWLGTDLGSHWLLHAAKDFQLTGLPPSNRINLGELCLVDFCVSWRHNVSHTYPIGPLPQSVLTPMRGEVLLGGCQYVGCVRYERSSGVTKSVDFHMLTTHTKSYAAKSETLTSRYVGGVFSLSNKHADPMAQIWWDGHMRTYNKRRHVSVDADYGDNHGCYVLVGRIRQWHENLYAVLPRTNPIVIHTEVLS
ncbi:hypothetical protein PR048_022217 [Dryococelus australis]|uniref:Uncharacterized protein n=1 Tax=Dryococelus australis TaxID=614101 RepID=A0ABQ9H0I7_9NEOP|nr:hypothetical protein PR048_022217 [Dryococelus australis]